MRQCLLIFTLASSLSLMGQTAAIQGHSSLGGTQAVTSGLKSTNYLNGIVPSARVSVYLTGTTTLATIYADGSGTPLANPFTSNTASSVNPGGWIFWAATNQGYDVVASGGIAPNTYPNPVTLCTDCYPGSQIAVNALTLQTNGTNNASQTVLNLINTASATVTNPSGGNVQIVASVTGNQSLALAYTPPTTGQFVVLYPTSAPTITDGAGDCAGGTSDSNAPYSATLSRTASGAEGCPGGSVEATWTGTALPSYVTASNVTAIYGGFIGYGTCPGNGDCGLKTGTVNSTSALSADAYTQGTQTAEIASGSGAQSFDYATVSWVAEDSSSLNWGHGTPIPSQSSWTPVLFVYYTGSAPPTPSAIFVNPPLAVADGNLSLVFPLDMGADTGSTNAYAVSLSPYVIQTDGLSVCFDPNSANTSTAPTLDVNGWAAWTIVKQGGAALADNDIITTAVACVRLQGDTWQLQNPQTGGGGSLTLTTTGTSGAATYSGGTLNVPEYQGALTLTTTGSSGAATLSGNTLNIPEYSGGGGGGVSGSGTTGYLPAWSGSTALGNSHIDDGVTTSSTITSSEPLAAPSYTANGSANGYINLTSIGTTPSGPGSSTVQITVPGSVTAYAMELPAAQPAGSDTYLSCTAANPSVCSWAEGGGSGGSGLFSGLITVPTRAGAGLTNSFNASGTFTQADNAVGFTLSDSANGGGDYVEGIYAAYPATPFTWTWLQAWPPVWHGNNWGGLVVLDSTTGPLMGFSLVHSNVASVLAYTTPTDYSSTVTDVGPNAGSYLWMQYSDNGTNITYSISADGVTWSQVYTVAKSSSFLGSSGFNYIGFAIDANSSPNSALTIMDVTR